MGRSYSITRSQCNGQATPQLEYICSNNTQTRKCRRFSAEFVVARAVLRNDPSLSKARWYNTADLSRLLAFTGQLVAKCAQGYSSANSGPAGTLASSWRASERPKAIRRLRWLLSRSRSRMIDSNLLSRDYAVCPLTKAYITSSARQFRYQGRKVCSASRPTIELQE